jgi:isopenicillin N synthase-like dioxygenase
MAAESVHIPAKFDAAEQVSTDELPIIDFGGFGSQQPAQRQQVIDEIGRACREIGFFYLTGHNLSQYLIDATFEQIRAYFAQPFATKMELVATTEQYRGYFPPRNITERADIQGGSMEAFRAMLDLGADDPDVVAGTPLYGPNRWPTALPTFRAVLESFLAESMRLAADLRAVFALALGLDEDRFEPFFTKPLINLQPAHYRGQLPATVAGSTGRELGVGEHRDTGGFTLLMQDDVPGLEVRDRSGRWIEAPLLKGAFIVNIGDSMMAWTNGEFVSTPHRVVNRSTMDRYIVALFMNPDYHCIVEPLADFVSDNRPAMFEPVHNGEYWWNLAQSAAAE